MSALELKLKETLSNLMKLHRRFLELERLQAESFFNRKINPFDFLQLLTQDKNFEWLKPFNSMLARVVAYIDENDANEQTFNYVKSEISKLLADPMISQRYGTHLANDREFATLHDSMSDVISNFKQ